MKRTVAEKAIESRYVSENVEITSAISPLL